MVKVEIPTEREKSLMQKTNKLMKITRQVLELNPSHRLDADTVGGIMISLRHSKDGSLWVNPENNTIYVDSLIYFNDALTVANAYELFTKEEFIIRKLY